MDLKTFINHLPKTELHMHLEGALEPELIFQCAERNKIKLPYTSIEQLKRRYQFTSLQSFLDLYFENIAVLKTEEDFYDLTMAYFRKVAPQGVKHAEIFLEIQTYPERGVRREVVIHGVDQACQQAEKELGISSFTIACFLRNLSEQSAFEVLSFIEKHRSNYLIGVGLASTEQGNPPSKFERVFKEAKKSGFHLVAHAGEETDASYAWQAINNLHVERIDHGINCLEDPKLVQYLQVNQLPLTVCPLSNVALQEVPDLKHHPLKKMFELGLNVSINSDDPSYFNGYIAENYYAVAQTFGWGQQELTAIARNSVTSSFLPQARKQALLGQIDQFISAQPR